MAGSPLDGGMGLGSDRAAPFLTGNSVVGQAEPDRGSHTLMGPILRFAHAK